MRKRDKRVKVIKQEDVSNTFEEEDSKIRVPDTDVKRQDVEKEVRHK